MYDSFILKLLLLISQLLSPSRGWKCGGSHEIIQYGPPSKRYLQSRSSLYSNIRLYFYFDPAFTLGDPKTDSNFNSTVIRGVKSYFTNALQVLSIQDPLSLAGYNTCNGIAIPSSHISPGLQDTDLVIYVTNNTLLTDYMAYASACAFDATSNNVIAGSIVINSENINNTSFETQLSVMIHETTHILGFSYGLFTYWQKSPGIAYKLNEVMQNINIRGTNKTVIITPNVLAKTIEAFGCNSIIGMELEEQGGIDTSNSHWGMRIIFNDIMISHVINDAIYSTITLALLEDTGWYQVDYSFGQIPIFARNIGCSYFQNTCLTNSISNFPGLFCNNTQSGSCDYFRLNKASCNVAIYTLELSPAFHYFSNPNKGGADNFPDFCPYKSANSNGSCRGIFLAQTSTRAYALESISTNSRCFESTLAQNPNLIIGAYSACYEVLNCTTTGANILIGSHIIFCPFTGGTKTLAGFSGSLSCPNSSILCSDVPCKNLCSGLGICITGQCNCFAGYTGDDCSIQCSNFCLNCTNITCLKCTDPNMIISGSSCKCSQNYTLNSSGICIYNNCSSLCINCSGNNCFNCSGNASLINNVCVCNTGYKYNGNDSCVPCNILCKVCNTNNCSVCINNAIISGNSCSCAQGYYFNNSQCVACQNTCNSCINSAYCTSCLNGTYLNQNNICLNCSNYCKNCSNNSLCFECFTNYFIYNGTCVKYCPLGTYISNNNCKECLIEYCSICDSSGTCILCKSGFSLNDKNMCKIMCPNNCINCDINGKCIKCSVGFLLDSGYCNECIYGYFLDSGKCNSCMNGCINCESISVCNACNNQFILINGACCILSCAECIESGICIGCNKGYFLSLSTCVECMNGCSDCEPSECIECLAGYYLYNGVCCSNSCSICNSEGTCIGCYTGFFLDLSTCIACDINCLTCNFNGCLSCISGSTLYNSTCCSLGCIICIDSLHCTNCGAGYHLINDQCSKCSSNCNTCISKKQCNSCASNYFLTFAGDCAVCPYPCNACISSILCTSCKNNFKLENGYCLRS